MKKTILVIDDEINIRELIKFNLEAEGYRVLTAADGSEGLAKAYQNVDLMVLDLMLPGMDGLAVCRQLRSDDKLRDLPIIMLTAKGEEMDKVLGLEMGADDYMTKPFSPRELLARIKAIFRRTETVKGEQTSTNYIIKNGELIIDIESHELYKAGQRLDLTPKEFNLLKLMMNNQNKVLTRKLLLEKVWGYAYMGDTRTVDVHIRRLRKKIGDAYIKTVRGVGYKFVKME